MSQSRLAVTYEIKRHIYISFYTIQVSFAEVFDWQISFVEFHLFLLSNPVALY